VAKNLSEQTVYDDEKIRLLREETKQGNQIDHSAWDLDRSTPMGTLKNLIRKLNTPNSSTDLSIAKALVLRVEDQINSFYDSVNDSTSHSNTQMARIMVLSDPRHYWLPEATNSEDPAIGFYPLVKHTYGNANPILKAGDLVEVQFNNPRAQFSSHNETGNIINIFGHLQNKYAQEEIQQCIAALPPIPEPPNMSIPPEQNMSIPPVQSQPNMSIPPAQPQPNMSIPPAQPQPNMSIPPEPNQQFTPNPSVPPQIATPPCAAVSTVAESAPTSTRTQPASSGKIGIIPRHPTDNKTVTSAFSPARKHPITGKVERHLGTDFRAPINAKFYAALDGAITYQVNKNKKTGIRDGKTGYGFYAYIKHTIYSTDPSASPRTFFTIYGHMKKDFPSQTVSQWQAKSGKKVKMGQVIGLSGNTGGSKGYHLHFEYNPNPSLFYASSTKKDPMTHFIGKTFYKS